MDPSETDGCVWEQACVWAHSMLYKLVERWGQLSDGARYSTVLSVMHALDRKTNRRLQTDEGHHKSSG